MSVEDETTDSAGRVGFRDIYRAVGESEARIVAALNAAVAPLTLAQADHEARLRTIETLGSPEAREALARISVLEAAVAPLAILATERDRRLNAVETQAQNTADAQKALAARNAGIGATFTGTQRVIITAAAVGGIITLLMQLVSTVAFR